MTTLLLARHGQTDWNLHHRWQGDPPLNATGRAQAGALARALAGVELDALVCSDLLRARETAEILSEQLGLPLTLDARLREVDVGEWAGLTTSEVKLRYPAGYARYRSGSPGWEQGESYAQVVERARGAVGSLASGHPGGRVFVVTHAGFLLATWLASGRALADWPGTRNADVHRVEADGERIDWVGLERSDANDPGELTIFWRVQDEPPAAAAAGTSRPARRDGSG
jgi:probable phosphoglycerate mutase